MNRAAFSAATQLHCPSMQRVIKKAPMKLWKPILRKEISDIKNAHKKKVLNNYPTILTQNFYLPFMKTHTWL
jgi:hypothetical protein